MPVSGLVITFLGSDTERETAEGRLREIPEVEIGEGSSAKLAIVVDSPSRRDDQRVWQTVQELPGVANVEVVFVGFDSEDPAGKDA